MKEQYSISKEKLVSLEEGLNHVEETSVNRVDGSGVCKQLIACIKFILYVELALFVGWVFYTMWQTYNVRPMEINVAEVVREAESEVLFARTSSKESMPDSMVHQFHDPDYINEAKDSNWEKHDTVDMSFSSFTERPESLNTAGGFLLKNFEPSTETSHLVDPVDEPYDNSAELQTSDNDFDESPPKQDVIEWNFPFLWSIHGLKLHVDAEVDPYENEQGHQNSKDLTSAEQMLDYMRSLESDEIKQTEEKNYDLQDDEPASSPLDVSGPWLHMTYKMGEEYICLRFAAYETVNDKCIPYAEFLMKSHPSDWSSIMMNELHDLGLIDTGVLDESNKSEVSGNVGGIAAGPFDGIDNPDLMQWDASRSADEIIGEENETAETEPFFHNVDDDQLVREYLRREMKI